MLSEIDGIRQRFGFFTNVFIEATTPADAESRAIDIIRNDARLRETALNAENDPVTFAAEETHEIESFAGLHLPRQGLSLYPEPSDDSKTTA